MAAMSISAISAYACFGMHIFLPTITYEQYDKKQS